MPFWQKTWPFGKITGFTAFDKNRSFHDFSTVPTCFYCFLSLIIAFIIIICLLWTFSVWNKTWL